MALVIIDITGGNAHITEQPSGVDVLVVDWDNLKESNYKETTDFLGSIVAYLSKDDVKKVAQYAYGILRGTDDR